MLDQLPAAVCVWYDLSQFQGHTSDFRPVDWGRLVQLGTKAVSAIDKMLIFISVVEVRVRLRQVVVMVRLRVSLEELNVSLCKYLQK